MFTLKFCTPKTTATGTGINGGTRPAKTSEKVLVALMVAWPVIVYGVAILFG